MPTVSMEVKGQVQPQLSSSGDDKILFLAHRRLDEADAGFDSRFYNAVAKMSWSETSCFFGQSCSSDYFK